MSCHSTTVGKDIAAYHGTYILLCSYRLLLIIFNREVLIYSPKAIEIYKVNKNHISYWPYNLVADCLSKFFDLNMQHFAGNFHNCISNWL